MPSTPVTALALLLGVAGLAGAAPARAQEADPYAACAAMADGAQRLACFDSTYAAWKAGEAERTRRAAEAAQRAAQLREAEFGLSGSERRERLEAAAAEDPALAAELARREAAGEDARDFSVTAKVGEVLTDGRRNQVLVLDNGQIWRERSGSSLKMRVREGWVANITRHWSGVHEIRFDGRSGYLRVDRVR